MKTDFHKRLMSLHKEVTDFLKKNIKVGQTVTLSTVEETDENLDSLNELPFISYVGKHGDYDEYAVLAITRTEKDEFTLHTRGKGEISDKEQDFSISEMQTDEVIFLADVVANHL